MPPSPGGGRTRHLSRPVATQTQTLDRAANWDRHSKQYRTFGRDKIWRTKLVAVGDNIRPRVAPSPALKFQILYSISVFQLNVIYVQQMVNNVT